MNFSKYSSKVRIGNWEEELYLEEEKLNIFLKKKCKGELMVQKVKKLFSNLLKEVTLSPPDDYVRFGMVVQLYAPDIPDSPRCTENSGLTLSCLVDIKEIDTIQHLDHGCRTSLAKLPTPCVRNCFIICSADKKARDSEPLLYGQEFLLRAVETMTGNSLYLQSEVPNLATRLGRSGNPPVTLTSVRDRYCRWRALYCDPSIRLEADGSIVPTNRHLVINHIASNKNLAAEPKYWFQTYFGVECEVSVHTYLDVHRTETAENIWMFRNQKGSDVKGDD